jgi:serine/threonine protein kinase
MSSLEQMGTALIKEELRALGYGEYNFTSNTPIVPPPPSTSLWQKISSCFCGGATARTAPYRVPAVEAAQIAFDSIIGKNPHLVANSRGDLWSIGIILWRLFMKDSPGFLKCCFPGGRSYVGSANPICNLMKTLASPSLQRTIDANMRIYEENPITMIIHNLFQTDPTKRLSAKQALQLYTQFIVNADLWEDLGRDENEFYAVAAEGKARRDFEEAEALIAAELERDG